VNPDDERQRPIGAGRHIEVEQLGRAFDSELRESCFQLLPSAAEIESSGTEAAHAARWQQWLDTDPRPLFAHIAVALPAQQGIQLLELHRPSGKLAPIAWPPHWTALRARLESVRQGRGPIVAPLTDPGSALIEFPVSAHSPRGERGGLERAWMIFELDLPYVWKTWFPELVRTHLNPDAGPSYDLEVRLASSTNVVLYTSEVLRDGQPVNLAAKEPQLLRCLIDHRGQVLTRERILSQVWKEQSFIIIRTVDVHVAWLRQKLDENPESPAHILTVRGEGYRFRK
jgi:hypothetical protein